MVTTWQIASALGLAVTEGMTDAEIAATCGVGSRACISKGRLNFQRANGIDPLSFQKAINTRSQNRKNK